MILIFDEDGYLIVYTDGSCLNNGKKDAIAGIGVFFNDNSPFNVSKKLNGHVSNNISELTACIIALNIIVENKLSDKVIIKTDSQYVINSLTKWIYNWKKNNWKTSTKKDVLNKNLIIVLDSFNTKLDIKYVYVKGHSGEHGNEMADLLSRASF